MKKLEVEWKRTKLNPLPERLNDIKAHTDRLKQTLAATANRLRRYKKSEKRRVDNSLFEKNKKKFYSRISGEEMTVDEIPNESELFDYWRNIWDDPVTHEENAPWIEEEKRNTMDIEPMIDCVVKESEVRDALRKAGNWKAPGVDGVHAFWLKVFTSTHNQLARCFTDVIDNPSRMPIFLCKGNTYLKYKSGDPKNPGNYRPITCLCSTYKILTSIARHKILEHIEHNDIMSQEQRGCSRNTKGCKEQLTIDSLILKQTERGKRNLYTAYVDYQKAYDSIPHSWLIEVLRIYKVSEPVIQFLQAVMEQWSTHLYLPGSNVPVTNSTIRITKGIYQGDSLSTLWFCLALNPLSKQLKSTGHGFQIKCRKEKLYTLSHLFYVDDLKLFGSTKVQIQNLLNITEIVSRDLKMKLGFEKCKILYIKKGKWHETDDFPLLFGGSIGAMEENDVYKYLGVLQNRKLNHNSLKEEIINRFKGRMKKLLSSGLNSRNMRNAINTFAIPLLTYTFGILKWSLTDLDALNRLVRTLLTDYRMHHPRSAVERMHLPTDSGGRGIIDIRKLCQNQVSSLRLHFLNAENNPLFSALGKADINYTALNLSEQRNEESPLIDENASLGSWKMKALHGRHPSLLEQPHVDRQMSNSWLVEGHLYPETEGMIIALQDQVISTRNYRRYILRENIDDSCRLCNSTTESLDHLLGGCVALAGSRYLDRHNDVAKIVHRELSIRSRIISTAPPYYKYVPDAFLENEDCKIYWDQPVITDHAFEHNRPDIIFVKKKENITYLIDIAIPLGHNLEQKHQEKIVKYRPLAAEIKNLWNQGRVEIVPIVISVLGVIPKTLRESLDTLGIPGHLYKQLQKASLLTTCTIIREVVDGKC